MNNEIQQIEERLSKLTPGFLALSIFLQVAHLTVTPTVEFVALRKTQNSVEVFLTRRPKDDAIWPNMLHIPGSVICSSDQEGSFFDAFKRVLHDEMGDPMLVMQPTFYKFLFHQVKRGREIAFIHWAEVVGEIAKGEFYDIAHLPADMVDHQKSFVIEVGEYFLSQKK